MFPGLPPRASIDYGQGERRSRTGCLQKRAPARGAELPKALRGVSTRHTESVRHKYHPTSDPGGNSGAAILLLLAWTGRGVAERKGRDCPHGSTGTDTGY